MPLYEKTRSVRRSRTDRRGLSPNASICYHVTQDDLDKGPGCFSIERRHHARGVFESGTLGEGTGSTEAKAESLAAMLPLSTWAESDNASIIWSMRWASNGLMPVRPQVVLDTDVELGPNSALPLWKM